MIWLTDNRSFTQYFQAKTIRPSVWNFLDRVLSFNIIIAGIPGTANYAADFLPRMQTDPSASLSLKLTDKVPVREIYFDSTARVPDASLNQVQAIEDAFSTNEEIDDNLIANLQRFGLYQAYLEKQNGKNGNEGLEPKALVHLIRKTVNAVEYPDPAELYNDLPLNSEPLNLKAEQQKDPDVENVKNWMRIGEIPDLTYANSCLKKYAKQFNRLIIEDEILFRNFYDDTGNIKHKKYCLPTHLWNEVIYRIHNSPTGGHIGMTRTNEVFRKRFYFPGFTEFLVNTIENCLTCLQVKNASNKHQTPPLQPLSSLQSFPGYMMQIDIVGPFKSPVYKFVLTGIDVFSKYLFSAPLTNASADSIARELTKMFFVHSYVPKRILSDLGSAFTSKLIHELTNLLDIKIGHATLKHPQTIGLVERSHGAIKRILKLNTDEQWANWHKYVPLATFIHNTSYYSSIGCCPSTICHERELIKPLDLRFSTRALEIATAEGDFVTTLQDATLEKLKETKDNTVASYHRYRRYYDVKALAQPLPLPLHSFCLLLNPLLTNQSDSRNKSLQVWIPLYRVEKVLTNSNYINRKVVTKYTQCVHRIRLRPIQPQYPPEDIEQIDQNHPSLRRYRSEPGLFDDYLPKLLEDIQPQTDNDETHDEAPATIKLSVSIGGPPAPMVAPLLPPLPPPAVPRAPLPDPVLEQPAIPFIERNKDPDRNEPIVNAPVGVEDKVKLEGYGFNLDRLFQEQPPRTKRKAAAEA